MNALWSTAWQRSDSGDPGSGRCAATRAKTSTGSRPRCRARCTDPRRTPTRGAKLTVKPARNAGGSEVAPATRRVGRHQDSWLGRSHDSRSDEPRQAGGRRPDRQHVGRIHRSVRFRSLGRLASQRGGGGGRDPKSAHPASISVSPRRRDGRSPQRACCAWLGQVRRRQRRRGWSDHCATDADGVRAPRLKSTKTGSRRVVTLGPALLTKVTAARAKYGDITTAVHARPRSAERRPHRLVVAPLTRDRWHRPALATPRPSPLVGHRGDRAGPGCADRRQPFRARRSSDDPSWVRSRSRCGRRGCGRRARPGSGRVL